MAGRYGGRTLVPACADVHLIHELACKETVSVLSYNIMRQLHATPKYKPYCAEYVLGNARRKEQLLAEIVSYDADILCLQEVDDYDLFWIHQLSSVGYDSVYHQRTGDYDDGLVVAFRRMNFQIFRTHRICFNELCARTKRENVAAKLQQDNVALLVALQPWEECAFPSPLCVVNVQLASHPDHEAVRDAQIRYLLPEVEAFNADFQMPLIVAGSFNVRPDSQIYHILRTGRSRPGPTPPTRMDPPNVSDATTSSLTLSWEIPISVDGPILGYRVDRRVNGSTVVGFTHEIMVEDASMKSFKATMLSAGSQYEFRVSAKNAFGWSEYSRPSAPQQTLKGRHHEWRGKPPIVPPEEDTNPFKLSYNSGKTPRFLDASIHAEQCPRPCRLEVVEAPYETLQFRGDREDGLLHYEVLESAYGRYNYGGEPAYTFATEAFTGTVDYIFFTKKELAAFQLLSLPPQILLQGHIQDLQIDYADHPPTEWDTRPKVDDKSNPKFTGEWATTAFHVTNTKQMHHWLPNDIYSSDHIALLAILAFRDEELAVSWN
ncbi:hypothetical protein ACHHYP_06339 [Achlya hypogyna]|uniref:Fibronectin type-III domain-containing protein n=1 Tax=Achlya hypogyna TaxID=1202772 RepID=A0A1V9YUF3_ACHHY|nr:hypothetical protein ACHHYP_06339 [Achlya hypogyna]